MTRKPTKSINLEQGLKQLTPARGPSFVSVVRPNYSWYEAEASDKSTGLTIFPTKRAKENVAGIVYPTLDTPEGRLIRLHELLHARYTPDVQEISERAQKAGFSNLTIQTAEDHRVNTHGKRKRVFEASDAYMDAEACKIFINSLARSVKGSKMVPTLRGIGEKSIVHGLTTGKVVQAALGLAAYPTQGFNPLIAQDIVSLCDPALVTAAGERLDVAKAQEIIDTFIIGEQVINSRKRKARAKRKSRRIFAELVRLVEGRLVAGYASEIEPPPPPPPPPKSEVEPPKSEPKEDKDGDQDSDEPKDGTPQDSPGEGLDAPEGLEAPKGDDGEGLKAPKPGKSDKPSKGGRDDEGDDEGDDEDDDFGSSDDDGEGFDDDLGFGDGDGSDADIDELFKQDEERRLSELRESVKKPGLFGLEKEDLDSPSQAMEERAHVKIEEERQRARDIDEQREAGVVLVQEVGSGTEVETITPPSASIELTGNELILSLTEHQWAPMTIQLAPLSRSKRNLSPRLGVAGIDGAQPKHLNRWFSDRAIMEVKGRRPGGAVLIDVSGSMSWTVEQTRKLLDEAPALTVAVYSSQNDQNYGVLTIIARNGRVVEEGFEYEHASFKRKKEKGFPQLHPIPGLLPHGYGNCCDGPALLWLAKQPGPRIWFCDGAVTGKRDNPSLGLTTEAFRLAYLAQATRTTKYQVVLDILRGKRKPNPPSPAFFADLRDKYERRVYDLDLFARIATETT